jgi:hypothetical protein
VTAYFQGINFNGIVQSLSSITAIEFQAWFTTTVKVYCYALIRPWNMYPTPCKVAKAGTYLLRCEGAHNFEFRHKGDTDDVSVTCTNPCLYAISLITQCYYQARFYHGDIYNRDEVAQPLALEPGAYTLRLRLRGKAQARFRCGVNKGWQRH